MISSLYINIIHVIQLLIKYTYRLAFSVLNVNLKSCDKVFFSCTQYFGNLNVIQAEISNLMKQYWPFPEWFLYSKLISDIFKKKKKYLRLIVFKENNSIITLNKYFYFEIWLRCGSKYIFVRIFVWIHFVSCYLVVTTWDIHCGRWKHEQLLPCTTMFVET